MLFFRLLKNQAVKITTPDYVLFGIFLLILLLQANNFSADFRGPFLIGAFTEPFITGLFALALGGILGLIFVVPVCAIYYYLLINSILLIINSRWWIAIFLALPIITVLGIREYNLEYERAYYQTYRDVTSIEECIDENVFEEYLCGKIIERNIYEKTNIEYCRTLRDDYSSCIQDIALFKKDVSICKHLNQDIALRYTGSSTSPYLRDCVSRLSVQENLTSPETCNIFENEMDFDNCLDYFANLAKDFSLCNKMKQEDTKTRCEYFRDQYLQSQ